MKFHSTFINNIKILAGEWVQVPISSTHLCEFNWVSSDLPFFVFYANPKERGKSAEQ